MRDLVKYSLESGGFVFIETEVADVEKGGLVKAGRGLPDEATQSFEATINSLSPIASSIVSKLINISNPPDEATVEFGLTLKADTGVVITKVGAFAIHHHPSGIIAIPQAIRILSPGRPSTIIYFY